MEKQSLTGSTAQKVIIHMQALIKVAFCEDMDQDSLDKELTRQINQQKQLEWNVMCDNVKVLWNLIEKKTDYTDDEVDKLHIMCNKFMDQWVRLFGPKHMTNYIHVIGAGHLTFFAAKYRNLYRFSQQGWESLNQLLKHYYFNNTNHGGAAGNGGKTKDGKYINGVISGEHCRPLMQLCQRSIMWKLGVGDLYFEGLSSSAIKSSEEEDVNEQDVMTENVSVDEGDGMMFGIL
jgi:hypothetical protein